MGKSSGKKKNSTGAGGGGGGGGASPAPSPATTTGPRAEAAPAAVPNGVQVNVALLLRRAHELKEEGNRLFQAKDYAGALHQYEVALRMTPRDHPDRAVFHSNRAACLMQIRPVDHEAVAAECSLALQSQPRFPRALLRRARALEALCRYDLALQDAHALLAIDPSNHDALDLARRLRASLTPSSPATSDPPTSRPSPAALGASAVLAGLGPSLPARPVPKKPSAQTTISTRPLPEKSFFSSPNHNYQLNSPPSALSNGPIPKQTPLTMPTASEDSSASQLFAKILDNSKVQQGNKNPPSSSVPSSASAAAAVTRWRPLKLVYDHDIRLAQMSVNCNFRALREVVAKRFPSSKYVLIKYKDADGDLITITGTTELKLAESSIEQIASKERKHGLETESERDEKLSVLRLHIVEVSPEQEPPVHGEEEEKVVEGEDLVKGDESLSHSSAEVEENDDGKAVSMDKAIEQKATSGKKECDHAECKEVELDDWLLQFAELFRNQVGIDPDAHLDLNEVGMELCSEALEETVTSEEAQGLFEMAAAKFQEVAALALFNWGNVHMCAARKRIPLDETASKEMAAQLSTAYDWVRERYALAGEKYEDAMRMKPDFYEGLLALGQQHFETAKLHWSFALADKADLTTWNSSETINLFNSAEEKMKAATTIWEKVEEHRATGLKDPTMSKIDEVLKKRRKHGIVDGQGEFTADEAAEQAVAMRQQIHLFWGNMLFERSQVEYKLGFSNWKENLDASVERFKLAGASEADISVVLKNHSSNGSAECDDKNVVSTSADASEMSKNDEDKHVLES